MCGYIQGAFKVFAERLCAYVGVLKLGSKVFAGCGLCFVEVVCFCRFDGVCGVFASRVTLCL